MTQTDILTRLSPALLQARDFANLLVALHQTPIEDISLAQANALSPIWDAMDIRPMSPHTKPALNRMFRDITRYYRMTQTQRPVLCRLSQDITSELMRYQNTPTMQKYGKPDIHIFGEFSSFGMKNAHILAQAPSYRFTFLTFIKSATKKRKKQIISMPIVALDDTILDQTHQADGHAFLSALQDAIAITNHDYIHHFTSTVVHDYIIDSQKLRKSREDILDEYNVSLIRKDRMLALYTDYNIPKPHRINISGYARIHTPVEAHAILSHKKLYELAGTAARDITTINTLFDRLEDVLSRVDNPWEIGAYYTLVLYDRLLSVMPHTHPVIQALEQRASALPIPAQNWELTVTHFMENNPYKTWRNVTLARHGIIPAFQNIPSQPATTHIRIAAHMDDMPFIRKIHHAVKRNADKTALPDLDKIITAGQTELTLHRRLERTIRADRAFYNRKNRPC